MSSTLNNQNTLQRSAAINAVQGTSLLSSNGAFAPGDFNRAPGVNGLYVVIGIDTTLDMPYAVNSNTGALMLCTAVDSLNRPTAWASKGMPTNTTYSGLTKLVTFKGRLYLYAINNANGVIPSVWSAAPTTGSTQLVWDAAPLISASTGSTARATDFNTDGTYLYMGEYGDPVGGPSIHRSADGVNWTTMIQFPIRHNHCVVTDPFNPGYVWMAGGDGVANPNMVSTDYGVTWSSLGVGSYQLAELSFTATDVWGADDTSYISAAYLDRKTRQWHVGAGSFTQNVAHPQARSGVNCFYDGSVTSGSTTFTSASAAFTQADAGIPIVGQGIPVGTNIHTVTNSTTVVLYNPANATVTNGAFVVGRRPTSFATAVFYGKVDPATGIMYIQTQQEPPQYPEGALFAILAKGAAPVLLDFGIAGNVISNYEQFLWHGRLFYGCYNRPLIQR